jgi:hypothetical protein
MMRFVRTLIATLAADIPCAGMAACEARSGPNTAALFELYSAEGCSSCPPADRQLGQLRQGTTVVPLALHVGYWDDLGWQDPYAQDDWCTRYTPQFFVGGSEVRPKAVADEVRKLNAQPSQASIRLQAHAQGGDVIAISARAQSAFDSAAHYRVVAENGLSSEVRAGENGGRRLSHDHMVRVWIGPLSLHDGSIALQRAVPLAKTWQRARLENSAFVQDQHTGRVLQAVGAGQCVGA